MDLSSTSPAQVFHRLKQLFPHIPEEHIREIMSQHHHDEARCVEALDDYRVDTSVLAPPLVSRYNELSPSSRRAVGLLASIEPNTAAGTSCTARLLHDINQPMGDVRIRGRLVEPLASEPAGQLAFQRTPLRSSTGALFQQQAAGSSGPRSSPVISASFRPFSGVHQRQQQQHASALVSSQVAAYNKLYAEVARDRLRYNHQLDIIKKLQRQLAQMAEQEEERKRLDEENARLRRECDALTTENENIQQQQQQRQQQGRHQSTSLAGSSRTSSGNLVDANNVEDPPDGPQWACGSCTFLNHPLISVCEQCDMPRIVLGTYGPEGGFGYDQLTAQLNLNAA